VDVLLDVLQHRQRRFALRIDLPEEVLDLVLLLAQLAKLLDGRCLLSRVCGASELEQDQRDANAMLGDTMHKLHQPY